MFPSTCPLQRMSSVLLICAVAVRTTSLRKAIQIIACASGIHFPPSHRKMDHFSCNSYGILFELPGNHQEQISCSNTTVINTPFRFHTWRGTWINSGGADKKHILKLRISPMQSVGGWWFRGWWLNWWSRSSKEPTFWLFEGSSWRCINK